MELIKKTFRFIIKRKQKVTQIIMLSLLGVLLSTVPYGLYHWYHIPITVVTVFGIVFLLIYLTIRKNHNWQMYLEGGDSVIYRCETYTFVEYCDMNFTCKLKTSRGAEFLAFTQDLKRV